MSPLIGRPEDIPYPEDTPYDQDGSPYDTDGEAQTGTQTATRPEATTEPTPEATTEAEPEAQSESEPEAPYEPPRGSPPGRGLAQRVPAAAGALLSGMLTAGLGLGALAIVALFLWITSPYPDSGPSGALRVVTAIWLLAHGGDLTRPGAADGAPVPLGLTPLMLTVLPVVMLNRAGALAAERAAPPPPPAADGDPARAPEPLRAPEAPNQTVPGVSAGPEGTDAGPSPRTLGAPATVVCIAAGYTLAAAGALAFTASGPLRSEPLAALILVPTIALLAVGAGVRSGGGQSGSWFPSALHRAVLRLPRALRAVLPAQGHRVAVRAATAGVLALLAGGALLVAVSLALHAGDVGESFAGLSDAASGQFAVLLLSVALMPNAAVWGMSYALTPGFTVTAGTVVGPLGTAEHGALPDFPLLAALPQSGVGSPLGWGALLVPLGAAAVAAGVAVRASGHGLARTWSITQTAAVSVVVALAAGAETATLAALASGPLGGERLAEFGPAWQPAGIAALCWTVAVCLPVLLVVRWWRMRRLRRAAVAGERTRWWRGGLRRIRRVVPGALRRRRTGGPDEAEGEASAPAPATATGTSNVVAPGAGAPVGGDVAGMQAAAADTVPGTATGTTTGTAVRTITRTATGTHAVGASNDDRSADADGEPLPDGAGARAEADAGPGAMPAPEPDPLPDPGGPEPDPQTAAREPGPLADR